MFYQNHLQLKFLALMYFSQKKRSVNIAALKIICSVLFTEGQSQQPPAETARGQERIIQAS